MEQQKAALKIDTTDENEIIQEGIAIRVVISYVFK